MKRLLKDGRIKKAIFKTISYRIIGSSFGGIVTYFVTNDKWISIGVGIGDFLVKPVIYFAHELVWEKISEKPK